MPPGFPGGPTFNIIELAERTANRSRGPAQDSLSYSEPTSPVRLAIRS
jgi:hypothetical protein